MLKNFKTSKKILLLVICCSILMPLFFIPTARAGTYETEHAIVQVRSQSSGGLLMCTLQFYTQATTYDPGSGLFRIIDYTSGIFNQYHFQWVPIYWWIFIVGWETRYVYTVLDIDWYEYSIPHVGIIVAGSTWRFKLYERRNPNNYIIFDLQAYVVAGGDTDIVATKISSSSSGWHHYVEEIDYNRVVVESIAFWID